MKTLKYRLTGIDDSPCDFADFGIFSEVLSDVLRRLYRSRNPGTSAAPRFEIVQLSIGSANCGIQGASIVIEDLQIVLSSIKSHETPHLRLTNEDVRAIRRLSDPLLSRTEKIVIGRCQIDRRFRDDCDWLIASVPPSKGQAIGRLEGMNVHNFKFFRLYPEGQDRGAECYFPDHLYDRVHSAMRKRVKVEGLIFRDPDGVGIDRIREITSVEMIPEDSELPPLKSLIGLFRDSPMDLSGDWRE